VTLEHEAYPWKLDEAEVPVTLEEEAYTVKQSEVQPLVGRGLLKSDPLTLKDHVGVTNACA